jgi:hypothetical protein
VVAVAHEQRVEGLRRAVVEGDLPAALRPALGPLDLVLNRIRSRSAKASA